MLPSLFCLFGRRPIICARKNNFMSLVSFYTPWKYQKNQRFSKILKRYRKRPMVRNALCTIFVDNKTKG